MERECLSSFPFPFPFPPREGRGKKKENKNECGEKKLEKEKGEKRESLVPVFFF
jgi:hypothetical protein